MSTLEKAVDLLQKMPDQDIETVYIFMRFMVEQRKPEPQTGASAFGIAHEYANADLISSEKEAFQNAMVKKYAVD